MTDFKKRFDNLTRESASMEPYEKVSAFLELHLEWAAALEATDLERAVQQYELAESCQSTIGTFATAGAEGLASMAALYEIMGKRADAIERLAATDVPRLNDALALWTRIQADPNGLGEDTPAASKIRQLNSKIRKLGGAGKS